MNIENVILGLQCCIEDNCKDCPYQNNTTDCLTDLLKDISEYIDKIKHIKE